VGIVQTGAILAGALAEITKVCAEVPGPFVYHIGAAGKPRRMD
jgi:hypothetical protein